MADKLANLGKLVVIAALDSDNVRETFENVKKLFAFSENIFKIFNLKYR